MAIEYVCDECSKKLDEASYNFATLGFEKVLTSGELKFNVKIHTTARDNSNAVLCKACYATALKSIIDAMSKETFDSVKAPEAE